MLSELLRRIRNLDDRSRPADRWLRGFPCFHDVGEPDAVVLGPDVAEPMMDIAPEHERIRGGVAAPLLVGDERSRMERRPGPLAPPPFQGASGS